MSPDRPNGADNAAPPEEWLNAVRWNADGLVPAIAQDAENGDVLMFAWMNRESLARTVKTGEAVYWSRSRRRLWHKGEESGHFQKVRELRLDCDSDTLLLLVEQVGGVACHTGRRSCFYRRLSCGAWEERPPAPKLPETIDNKTP
ncbi:MAG: phosphoribosyl-AMP cyclohydrolase [Zoogloeaceae bacterium]|nr:phosphoribosyl-AMP cyclohydrolase [Zoogloeaceae bacterium]